MDIRVKAAQVSVLSNSILVILKLLVGILMGSVSVLSEAIHSGLDLIAALIAFFSVKRAAQPADEQHQFGHGKFENVSGVIEALLILVAAVWIIIEAYKKFVQGSEIQSIHLGILVMAFASIVNFFVARYLFRVAEKTDSIALKADAMHLSTDVITSVGIMAGLILIKITGIQILDPLFAVAVAILIIKTSFDLTKESFSPLLDTKLPDEEEQAIVNMIKTYCDSFIEFHNLRSRKAGSERHIDLHLVVPHSKPVQEVHELCDHIEDKIKRLFPSSQVLIHIEPCNKECADCTFNDNCTEKPSKDF
ncbi:MAG: cation diffusion facilitator family transporter [Desulfitobacteriaceae bacterium]|nr:cation diffusion facilitator family transporter [Desulfitobacteriaceae bacterium]